MAHCARGFYRLCSGHNFGRSTYDSGDKVRRHSGSRSGVSLKFYTEMLGLRVITDQPFTDTQRWIELLIPGAETGLALYTPEGQERRIGEFQSIAFWCDDVFATAKVSRRRHGTRKMQ
jgi:hypothetical protein